MSKSKDQSSEPPVQAPPEAGASEDLAAAARKSAGKGVWMGTAVGIGSAAIVAALLYARKKN